MSVNDFRKDFDFRTEIEKIRSENQISKPDFKEYAREVVSFIQNELLRKNSDNNLIAAMVNFESHKYNDDYGGPYLDFVNELVNLLDVDFIQHYTSEDDADEDEDIYWRHSVPSWVASQNWKFLIFQIWFGRYGNNSSQSWEFGDIEIHCKVDISNAYINSPDSEEYEDDDGYMSTYHVEYEYLTDHHFFTLMLL